MDGEYRHTPEPDLDKTDRLPVLQGTIVAPDVADDAVPLDHTAVLPADSFTPVPAAQSGFVRAASVDLPSLAESVRSVEERIDRQHAEYEVLTRAYERAREAESTLGKRANALAADLATARTAIESEKGRSRELERVLGERNSALETVRARVGDALRESERHASESHTLRESLAARDATIVQVLHSLGERDAQLSALQQEHARVVPALEANAKSTSQMEADLRAARADANALGAELKASREKVAALNEQLKRSESEINATRYDLGAAKIQASSYLELLRTREWRSGFDQNLFRELDARVGAADAGHGELESQRDRLQGQVAALEARLSRQSSELRAEGARLMAELAARDRALTESRERGSGDAAQVQRLQSEAQTHEQELAVLMAHLQEARRPMQSIEADVKRLTEELAAKSAAVAELEEEKRKLRSALERTQGTLEEREFLIRRLEHSESNNANVIGRIQTSIERLGSVPIGPAAGAAAGTLADAAGELIKVDGAGPASFALARRTRIGRSAACEMQIDSGSVSRHHALVLVGPRDTVIEDLNSTNGVLVNGRKVMRQVLSDGDAITLGESRFRYCARPLPRSSEPSTAEPLPGE
ncbi:MAG TPA: FHA domain-containing protein [Steroidobacteraceae bacterium]|nr:FHA domain-containing protein [Steroidobacteraceae bacterium]